MATVESADADSEFVQRAGEGADAELGDEDAVDWTQYAAIARSALNRKAGASEAYIPKRGDKDFAPELEYADRQSAELAAAREALFDALTIGQTRQHSARAHNRATWHPELCRAAMAPMHMYGVHFQSIGHHHAKRKRTELYPEEALYLVDRGNLECWTEEDVPMSAQQAWSTFIGSDELTLERYQVYSYLKRLGYVVLRAEPAIEDEPEPARPRHRGKGKRKGLRSRVNRHALGTELARVIVRAPLTLLRLVAQTLHLPITAYRWLTTPPALPWPGPRRRLVPTSARGRSLLSAAAWRTYDQLFSAIQIIPTGHALPGSLSAPKPTALPSPAADPWRVFFHVYRPITKFGKTEPPEPDFRLAVVDVQKTGLPDLEQLRSLFDSLPAPEPFVPPTPRPRPHRLNDKAKPTPQPPKVSFLASFVPSFLRAAPKSKKPAARGPNPFPRLKNGRRSVVIAVVDTGLISWLRVNESEFGEVSLVGEGKIV